jgi:ribosomal protein S18 acetylase RimI-like enzyme
MSGLIIRNYKSEDYQRVRQIAYDTAFMGNPAEIFFNGKEFIEDFLTLYFTYYEPESCFVAEKNGKIIGYLTGSKNEKRMNNIFLFKIIPKLFFKYLFSKTFFKKKNLRFIIATFNSFIKGELKMPDSIKEDYPALMHINIDKDYRNSGIGRMLIESYIDYLKSKKVLGLHLTTQSENSFKFFEKLGFIALHETKRSYFRNILNKEIRYIYYGKKLV